VASLLQDFQVGGVVKWSIRKDGKFTSDGDGSISGNVTIGGNLTIAGTLTGGDIEGVVTMGTAVATTSGSNVIFSGLPAGIKRIVISLSGVSTNGTGNLFLRIANAVGGVGVTGYLGSKQPSPMLAPYRLSMRRWLSFWGGNTAAHVYHGTLTLTPIDPATFLRACTGTVGYRAALR
jgi:hypothetical protein